ncbi:hypothetical protein JET18_07110 [Chryseobacterium sp. L7]|uniref:Uncharacterized protein n=1 Tax=Chryseobacterium endalhagicum TaxID=2797638 RepID=A0ABS1QE62_9FLAO|nr:hypothetical protein [Chryseobacterium endalhagicum]MBL1220601.1 hypothetical protein [Chryseobacterium endalhagicum]
MNENIRIEEVGDINSDYPYLEVFLNDELSPFLEISIDDKELSFKIYSVKKDIILNYEGWKYIYEAANEFLPRALKNEDDYLNQLGNR